jgi:hypothetical protein
MNNVPAKIRAEINKRWHGTVSSPKPLCRSNRNRLIANKINKIARWRSGRFV